MMSKLLWDGTLKINCLYTVTKTKKKNANPQVIVISDTMKESV